MHPHLPNFAAAAENTDNLRWVSDHLVPFIHDPLKEMLKWIAAFSRTGDWLLLLFFLLVRSANVCAGRLAGALLPQCGAWKARALWAVCSVPSRPSDPSVHRWRVLHSSYLVRHESSQVYCSVNAFWMLGVGYRRLRYDRPVTRTKSGIGAVSAALLASLVQSVFDQ